MKTLTELWKENGEKLGLKVRQVRWDNGAYFVILGPNASGSSMVGYRSIDDKSDAYLADYRAWELYVEPEELVDHWPAVFEGAVEKKYMVSEYMFQSVDEARAFYGARGHDIFIRLATELPPIKLPRRK